MAGAATIRPQEIVMVIENAGERRRIVVTKTPFTIGRADTCDAVIADFRVSRLHARLEQAGGGYYLVDSGSRHGTFVNGAQAERTRLKNNDEITLGVPGLKLIFLERSGSANATQVLLRKFSSDTVSSELEKLTLFLEAARTLSSGVVVHDVLRNMLDYALRLTKADRGFVYLKQPDGTPALACGLDAGGNVLTQDANVTRSVVREAMSTAAEFIAGDATQQSALAARESIVLNELRTVIAIPLRERRLAVPTQSQKVEDQSGMPKREVDGVLYLDSRAVSRNLSGVSHDVLRALAGECATVLESARLMEAEQAARQYRQEMEIAASIQRSLISEPEIVCDFARVNGRSIPCKEVGGDFFDVFVAPYAVTVIVADVSGKGISAALLASVIHGMFYAQVSSGAGLADAVTAINRFLCSRVAGQKYATLVAARLRRDGMLEMINCGHVPPIVAQDGEIMQITDGDPPVGLLPQAEFHSFERKLAVGSRLLVLTDGISETENAQGEEFALGRVEQHAEDADAVNATLAAVEGFCGSSDAQDDRTLVVLERTK